RTIGFNVWYPTEDTVGEEVRYLGFNPDEDALGGASLASPLYDGRYPVMVYSHGWQGWGGTSADLCRWFASHGWVVVAPDHTGNTFLDHSDPLETAHYLQKPQDLKAVLDELDALPAGDPLAGLADTSAVVLSGHSYGASLAAWAGIGATFDAEAVESACAGGGALPTGQCTPDQEDAFLSGELTDPRFVASIPLAGTIRRSFFGPDGHLGARGPVMSMTGSNDGSPQSYIDQWDSIEGIDFSWVSVEGACHQTFALGTCNTLDKDERFRIVDTYALAFARAHVLGDEGDEVQGILDGTVEVSALVTFSRKGN
ncbi:MAG: dienelactone hydrolase family protein, partial [Deltaproteobacteria bacterium]|nr:dienelactone hydrolase family protein [Deltaproteobacteria bacterium]